MKPTDFVLRAVLACLLSAAVCSGAQAANEEHVLQGRVARFDAQEAALQRRLATPEAARVFRDYNAAHGQQIQQNLAIVYAADADYLRDAGGAARPLGDSVVGPVTLKWLARFCRDYGIVAGDADFAQDVAASLEQVALIARAHPDWTGILGSADFEAWIEGQPSPQRVQSLKVRRSGAAAQVNALIAQYLKERRPAAARARPAEPLDLTFSYDPKRIAPPEDLKLIAQRLRPLVKRPAEDEELFDADLKEALDGVPLHDDTLALIKRYSRVDAYAIGPDLLLNLEHRGMAQPAVIELRTKLGNLEYDSAPAFEQALASLADGSEFRDAYEGNKRSIVQQARLARFQVPETLADDMAADAPLPAAIAAVFAHFANVEYPTKELFDSALEWQVRRSLAMCRDPRRQPQGALDDAQFKALADALPELADAFTDAARLRAVRGGCSADEQIEADQLAFRIYLNVSPRLDRKMELQAGHAMPQSGARKDAWATPSCGCGRHERDGMVVGFYPLWTDGAGRKLDFGALTRLNLYGLTADDTGGLHGPPGMTGTAVPDDVAALMREAHRHDVRVDWTVARSDWSVWNRASRGNKREVLAALEASIVALLERPLPDGGQLLTRLGSLGADRGPTGGDGVALYFRHFPAADKDLYNDFVRGLDKRLKALRPARRLSIIVDYDDVGKAGPFDFRNLIDLVADTNPLPEGRSFADSRDLLLKDMPVLVMLPDPTQNTKKGLRGAIQDALRGTDSARLLRSLVPVLEYDGIGSQQLADDIVYASDNFFGIGFWPLPFAAADGTAPGGNAGVNRLLERYFQPNDGVPSAWHHFRGALCPQRLWLRWTFWITLATALCVGTYYFSCRGCNERLDNSGLYFAGMMGLLALPLATLLVLMVSDPLLDPYMVGLLVLYGTGGLAVAGLVARYYFNKSRRKLP